jgi:hypothetical protein
MERLNKAAQIGIGFIGLGFLVIFIAWNGAAEKNCVDCQVPYLISGGATAIGLIIIGSALIMFEAARRDRAHLDAKLTEIANALQNGAAGFNGVATVAPVVTAPVPAVNTAGLVVLGRTSYHQPDCRLVEGKEDVEYGTEMEALARGLNVCRVCEAATAATSEPDPEPVASTRRRKR